MPGTKQAANQEIIADCWNHIGVWGKQGQVCEKLANVIHCRNCEAFITAGRLLLDRKISPEYQEEWCNLLIKEKNDEKKSNAVVIFRLGGEWFGLPASIFHEILKSRPVHSIPHNRDPALVGIVSIHGELQLCVSLEHILRIGEENVIERATQEIYERMAIIEVEGFKFVFPVSEIRDIHYYADNDLENAPITANASANRCLRGILTWRGQHVGCLDHIALISLVSGLFR